MSGLFDEASRAARPPTGRSGRSRALLITAGVLIVGFLALTGLSSFWTERLWFNSEGYGEVFSKLVWTRVLLFVFFGVLMGLAVTVSMLVAFRLRPIFRPASSEQTSLDRYRDAITPLRKWVTIAVAALLGIFAGTSAAGQWRHYLLWRHREPFGKSDPYFGRDIGFYVFSLPWWHFVVDFVMVAAVVCLLTAAVTHYLYGGIRLQAATERLSGPAAAQLSIIVGVFMLAKGVDYWLDRFDVLTGSGRLIDGMTYTDDHAVLPAKNILLGIAVICALLFFLNVWRRSWMLPTLSLGLFVLSAILLGLIWPGVVQQFQVGPSEADKEAPYISRNIEATRAAYDLEKIAIQPYSAATAAPNATKVIADTASVPLVDPQEVRETFQQTQQVTGYYSVPPVLDVDRYLIDERERALVLGVRELDQSGLAESSKNWSNLHTVYTHGFGMIAAYGNQRDASDQVASTSISDSAQWAEGYLPPRGALTDEGDGYQPRVYFGEDSPNYSIVGKTASSPKVEFDQPDTASTGDTASDDTQGSTYTYDGASGVSIGGLWHQLLYSVKFSDPNILLSSRVNSNSKILYDRKPAERVEKVAPWLAIDGDPYPAVVDGRVVWILDGYTSTDHYPLAEKDSFKEMTDDSLQNDNQFQALPTDEINYMRNAVKATVDAYDGTVTLYAWDETDPMLKAWEAAFPGTVKPKTDISPDLMSHLRYPEDLFKVQRYQYARYHVTDSSDWYEGNDRWVVPTDPDKPDSLQPPYRLFVDLPDPTGTGTSGSTYSMTSVYVPNKRQNLASFMSVDSDATDANFGQIRVLRTDTNILGPSQVANTFQSDQDVKAELQPYNVGGTPPIYANLLTLPVDGRLLYVQPVYTQRSGTASYPILTKVLTSFGDQTQVGIGDNLPEAIGNLLNVSSTTTPPTTRPPTSGGTDNTPINARVRQLLNSAQRAFNDADTALKKGDSVEWARQTKIGRDLITQAVRLARTNGNGAGNGGGNGSGGGSGSAAG